MVDDPRNSLGSCTELSKYGNDIGDIFGQPVIIKLNRSMLNIKLQIYTKTILEYWFISCIYKLPPGNYLVRKNWANWLNVELLTVPISIF